MLQGAQWEPKDLNLFIADGAPKRTKTERLTNRFETLKLEDIKLVVEEKYSQGSAGLSKVEALNSFLFTESSLVSYGKPVNPGTCIDDGTSHKKF